MVQPADLGRDSNTKITQRVIAFDRRQMAQKKSAKKSGRKDQKKSAEYLRKGSKKGR